MFSYKYLLTKQTCLHEVSNRISGIYRTWTHKWKQRKREMNWWYALCFQRLHVFFHTVFTCHYNSYKFMMAPEMSCYANTLAHKWKMSDYGNLINYMTWIKKKGITLQTLGYVLGYTTAHWTVCSLTADNKNWYCPKQGTTQSCKNKILSRNEKTTQSEEENSQEGKKKKKLVKPSLCFYNQGST